jgi:4-diphosphocytidyl-2-C-methyl-D-erythritol kinase
LCEGRGERVRPAPPIEPAWSVALITPDVGCATASVYAALEIPLSRSRETHSLPMEVFRTGAREARRWLRNDLERAALTAEPRLRAWREAVDAGGGRHFLLSGSGSSFFGVFDDAREGRAALAAIEREARARGLAARGLWLTQPCGWSIKFLSET